MFLTIKHSSEPSVLYIAMSDGILATSKVDRYFTVFFFYSMGALRRIKCTH